MKAVERLLALLLFVAVSPTLLWAAVLLRINSPDPILLTDEVLNQDGSVLRSYRFRTTGRGSDAFRLVGRILRRFSIDELPGLWAVVQGRVGLRQFLRIASVR